MRRLGVLLAAGIVLLASAASAQVVRVGDLNTRQIRALDRERTVVFLQGAGPRPLIRPDAAKVVSGGGTPGQPQLKLLDPVVNLVPVQAEKSGGVGLIPVGPLEGLPHERALDGLEIDPAGGQHEEVRRLLARTGPEIRRLEDGRPAQHDGALDRVSELGDISRP
jgi:hypothetical protein